MKKLVSVVLPTHNGAQWLRQAVDSVLNQTYTDIELICVNDASTDETGRIIEECAQEDSRVKIITNEVNQKLPKSLNIGFKQAEGEYFTWTSDDNWYEPTAIEKMVDHLENHSKDGMVVCAYEQVNVLHDQRRVMYCDTSPEKILADNTIGSCFMYRRSIAHTVGAYDQELFLVEDWDYWLRLLLIAPLGKIDECLYHYRTHDKSLTYTRKKQIAIRTANLRKKMYPVFRQKFPHLDFSNAEEAIHWDDLCLFHQENSFSKLRLTNSSRSLFCELRRRYRESGDPFCLQCIRKIGLKYLLKSYLIKKKGNNL